MREEKRRLIAFLLYVLFCSVSAHSFCDEVDSVFIFDTDLIVNDPFHADKIEEFIESVIYEASSEDSGVGFIVYGDLPITLESDCLDDLIILGLEETKFHSTIQTQEIIHNNLDFTDFYNENLMNGANRATFESALQSAHNLFIDESTVKNDVIFIIDTDHNVKSKCIEYASNQNSDDIEEIYFVEIVFNGDGDIELDHVFDCKHNGKESEKYAALIKLYDITCPCLMQFDATNYAKCNRKDQWIDADSVISCNIDSTHDPISHRLIILPSSTMIVNDTKNDSMSFEKGYILLTSSNDVEIMEEKGCYIPVIKITKIEAINDEYHTLFKLNIIAVSIFEYISEGHMKYHQDPPPKITTSSSRKRRRMLSANLNTGNITISDTFTVSTSISRDKWSLTGTGTFDVTGWAYFGVLFGIDFELDIRWCWIFPCGIDNFLFAVYGGIDIDLVLNTVFKGSLEVSYDLFEKDGNIIKFFLWFIPVWFAPRLEMSQFLTLQASYTTLTHQLAIHFHPFYKLGVQFDGSDWISLNEYTENNAYSNKFFIANGDTSAYPGCPSGVITTGIELKLGGTVYSTVFIYLSLIPALKAEVELPSICGGDEENAVCTDYVPNYIEINPSLVLSMGVGFEILENFITKLIGAAGKGYDVTIIDEEPIIVFPQICVENTVAIKIQSCCQYASTVTTEPSGTMRLADGSTTWEGRVEVSVDGFWKTVCNDNVDNDVGKVICGELGFETEGFTLYKTDGDTPYGEGVGFIGFSVNCDGNEDELYECQRNDNHGCDHNEDLSIKCIPPPAGTLSLKGSGSTESQGRIEIFDGTEWGTVCNSGISDSYNHIGMVICRQQGLYPHFYTLYTSSTPYGHGRGSIVMDDIVCDGSEENLLQCKYDSTPNCIHNKDLSIKCHVAPNGYIRLTGSGSTEYAGTVEIADGSEWRGVCNDNFDSAANAEIGAVICRQFGHSTTGYTLSKIDDWISTVRAFAYEAYSVISAIRGPANYEIVHNFANGDKIKLTYSNGHKMIQHNGVNRAPSVFFSWIESQQKTIADVNCIGDEYRLEHCGHSSRSYCPGTYNIISQLSIECIPSQSAVRLNGIGSTEYEGRMEVYIGNEWGTICNDGVDVNVGRVICKLLGYSTDGLEIFVTDGETPYGEGTGSILMSEIQCIGTEVSLLECDYTSNHNCDHTQDVSIKCQNPKEGDIRLSQGGSLNEGRIEVFIASEWGTVCNDGINYDTNNIGAVICNQLGYLSDGYTLYNKQPQQGELPYGAGTTPILMDNVICYGDESKLIDCTFSEQDNCGHHEDLAIKCQTLTCSDCAISFDYVSDETFLNGETIKIGWMKYSECNEAFSSDNVHQYREGLTVNELVKVAQSAITVKILPSTDIPGISETDEYAVTADLCSNPVFALNNGFELSYTVNMETLKINGNLDISDWIGTTNAINRIKNGCYDGLDTDLSPHLLTNDYIFHACDNSQGLHLLPTHCGYDYKDFVDHDVTIWLGFNYFDRDRSCEIKTDGSYDLFDYTSDETFSNGQTIKIGWMKYSQCDEAYSTADIQQYRNGYTVNQLVEMAQSAVTVKILPSTDIPGISETDEYAVTGDICSNPIFALNNGFELSYNINMDTLKVDGYQDISNWIGTTNAINRVRNTCIAGLDIGSSPHLLTNDYIYQSCGTGIGIHLLERECGFDWLDIIGHDVTVWIGFDYNGGSCQFKADGSYELFNYDYISNQTLDNGEMVKIGWMEYSQCNEGYSTADIQQYRDGYTVNELVEIAQSAISVKILPSTDIPGLSETDEYAVTTEVCSNPIFALNKGFELSYNINMDTLKINGYQDISNWIGTTNAINRVKNLCIAGLDIGSSPHLLTNDYIFQSCGTGIGIHLLENNCGFDWQDIIGHDVKLWLGFNYYGPPCRVQTDGSYSSQVSSNYDYVSDETFSNGETIKIGWMKYSECDEADTGDVQQYRIGYTVNELVEMAQSAITVKILPSTDIPGISETDEYAVTADVCSNPILALNNGFELSYNINVNTLKINGNSDISNWIGTANAKNRVRNTCIAGLDIGSSPHLLTDDYIFHSCGGGDGMHLLQGHCWWDYQSSINHHVTVWLGFNYNGGSCRVQTDGIYGLGTNSAHSPGFHSLQLLDNKIYINTLHSRLLFVIVIAILLILFIGYFGIKNFYNTNNAKYEPVSMITTDSDTDVADNK